MVTSHRKLFSLALAVALSCTLAGSGQQEPKKEKKGGFAPKTWDQQVDQAVAYLKAAQADDGTWSKAVSPGITGVVLNGLLRSGKVTTADPVAAKGLKFIEAQISATEGHIAGDKSFQKNYLTCVNLLALHEANKDKKYASVLAGATAYLKGLQWNESTDKTPKDAWYGGVGYAGGTRPDLSNTHFFLDALKAGGVPAEDPAYRNAVVFVSRCQNLKGETNDQPWANKINDGSFIYVLGDKKGASPVDPAKDIRPGYGSMTFAGLKALADGGVPKKDRRFEKAWEWVGKHYSVDVNHGLPSGSGGKGYYYYLDTMAKCLTTLGIDEVVDSNGVKHDWRADIRAALGNRQKKEGSWSNDFGAWMESNPDLCTAYALDALSYCKPK